MSSLSIPDDQMSHMSVSDDDDGYSSDCSHYSLPDLEDDEWLRHIPASRSLSLGPSTRDPFTRGPFTTKKNDRFRYGNPGPARVVVSPSEPEGHDVVYHPNRDSLNFLQAKYRPRGYRRIRKGPPTAKTPPKSPSTSSLPTPVSSPMSSPTLVALPSPRYYSTYFAPTTYPCPPQPQSPGCVPYQQYHNYPTSSNYWTSPYTQNPTMSSMLQPVLEFYPVPVNIGQCLY
ncbi:hypothetical protein B0J13DRAFT_603100 [Dactylonectria estremocensis]|uniref:Uncharacterized protein n=1 Tax=Dactylonectria estremocensis TaxID=1079267 RepID=A0A9P9FAU2_9HYPO|nr:hypothetical protein B0J13DRAFT_603100 [Dactylonectria estremocensis]